MADTRNFTYNGKTYKIPVAELARIRKNDTKLSIVEACELYLFDNGYIEDDTVNALTAKAEKAGTMRVASTKKRKAPTRKPDMLKRSLVNHLFEALGDYDDINEGSLAVTNIERTITFSIGEDTFEVNLSKKRKPKD